MDNYKYDIIEKYFDTDNVKFDFNTKIKLDEENSSPFFIDVNGILTYPLMRDNINKLICSMMDKEGLSFNLIAGADHSGIPFSVLLSSIYKNPVVYIRNSSKKHGKQNKTEGKISGGEDAVVFTDYYSSSLKVDFAVAALKEADVNVKGIVTVFNYTDDDEYNGIKILSLFSKADFIQAAEDKKLISSDYASELKDPEYKSGVIEYREKMVEEGAEILLEINAVSLSVSDPYRYASGILSPIYCDNRLLISYPEKWDRIIDSMINIIESKIGLDNFDIIGGTSTAGIPHSVKIAEKLKKPLVYIKSDPGSTGKKSEIEGSLVSGKRVLIIEDLISKGGSALKAVNMVRNKNGIADYCLAIFTYEMESSRKVFEENNCSVFTVSRFSKLIETAAERKYISSDEMEKALDWNRDPENWGRKYGFEK